MNEQLDLFNKIYSMQQELTNYQTEYWKLYSSLNTWQFWFLIALIVLPLIALYILIDKDKIFLIGFYGLCVHMIISHFDKVAVRMGYWQYYHTVLPFLAFSLAFDIALVPAVLMLVYQWTLKHNKNFYIYSILAAFLLSIIWTPIFTSLGILQLYKGMNLIKIFAIKICVVLLARFIVFLFFYKKKS
jgi:hypothetical protein